MALTTLESLILDTMQEVLKEVAKDAATGAARPEIGQSQPGQGQAGPGPSESASEDASTAPALPSVAVWDDPSGELLKAVLAWPGAAEDSGVGTDKAPAARSGAHRTIVVASRTLTQAKQAEALAEEAGRRHDVLIAGVDGPLELPVFFEQLAAGELVAGELVAGQGASGGVGTAEADARNAGVEAASSAQAPAQLPIIAIGHTPKSIAELEYLCAASPSLRAVVVGANNKHMSHGHNHALSRFFPQVRASRGRGKFRCLIASGQHTGASYEPATSSGAAGEVIGVGSVFSGGVADAGGQLLARTSAPEIRKLAAEQNAGADAWSSWDATAKPSALEIVDLGCGNGSVSLEMLRMGGVHVLATDIAADAVVSARRTLASAINSGRARVTWDDAATNEPDSSADVVLLNPPFHAGAALDMTLVQGLLDAAARLLRAGGRIYMVHNSYLRYRPELEARFGKVRQLARNSKFTVLAGEAPSSGD